MLAMRALAEAARAVRVLADRQYGSSSGTLLALAWLTALR